jgi:hypothetical protein
MKIDRFVRILLLVIAVSLAAIALRPYLAPPPAMAQSADAYPLYIEPGTNMLRAPDGSRQAMGKVVIDLRNGNIWGFPTLSPDPYPSPGTSTTPPTSHPFFLGKFAFADLNK